MYKLRKLLYAIFIITIITCFIYKIREIQTLKRVVIIYNDGSTETITTAYQGGIWIEAGCVYFGSNNPEGVKCGARSFKVYDTDIKANP